MTDTRELLEIMARLRAPDGCPWDREQDFKSIALYTIEEAYEVADAIEREDPDDLKDELGDLLLQVVFHSQMAQELDWFDYHDVVSGICAKMTRRHPHVFADSEAQSTNQVKQTWNRIKAQERADNNDPSALAGIAAGLPEWMRTAKLTKRAAEVGFDWPDAAAVLEKIAEELAEMAAELEVPERTEALEMELGDLLFAIENFARKAGLNSGRALRLANAKFERRFRAMESLAAAANASLADLSLKQQDELWERVKRAEGQPKT